MDGVHKKSLILSSGERAIYLLNRTGLLSTQEARVALGGNRLVRLLRFFRA